jgi:hypothetical protein
MTGWIIRRRARGAEAVASLNRPIGRALMILETAERTERYRASTLPRPFAAQR